MHQTAWRADSLTPEIWHTIFHTKYTTVRTAILTPIMVAFMFVALRLAGPRTLTQSTLLNKIVLVAVGSLVGGVALRPGTPLTAALIALGMILIADAAYAWGWLPAGVVHARPLLMYADGQILTKNLRHALLSPDKLHSELRLKEYCSFDDVTSSTAKFAVILEPTGSWSVITKDTARKSDLPLLRDVVGYDQYLKPWVQGAYSSHDGRPIAGHQHDAGPRQSCLA